MNSAQTKEALADLLQRTAESWTEEDVELEEESTPLLTSFYVVATFENVEETNVIFTLSGDGVGGDTKEWVVRGLLDIVRERGLYGIWCGCEDED